MEPNTDISLQGSSLLMARMSFAFSEAFLHLRSTETFGNTLQRYRSMNTGTQFGLYVGDECVVQEPTVCTNILASGSKLLGEVELRLTGVRLPDLGDLAVELKEIIESAEAAACEDRRLLSEDISMAQFASGLRPGEVDCFEVEKFRRLADSPERAAATIHLNMCACRGLVDADLALLARFTALESLALRGVRIGDQAMCHIAAVRSLQSLDITGSSVGDEGLKALFDHPSLRVLRVAPPSLSMTPITREGAIALLNNLGQRLTILQS